MRVFLWGVPALGSGMCSCLLQLQRQLVHHSHQHLRYEQWGNRVNLLSIKLGVWDRCRAGDCLSVTSILGWSREGTKHLFLLLGGFNRSLAELSEFLHFCLKSMKDMSHFFVHVCFPTWPGFRHDHTWCVRAEDSYWFVVGRWPMRFQDKYKWPMRFQDRSTFYGAWETSQTRTCSILHMNYCALMCTFVVSFRFQRSQLAPIWVSGQSG